MRVSVSFFALLILAAPAIAAEADPPVLLNGDVIIHDEKAQTITVRGHVQLARDGSLLVADELIYHRATDVVKAVGNVRLWQPTGEVVQAKEVELTRDLKQGFIAEAGLMLTDSSRFVAVEGERTEGRFVRMNKAIYSACLPCRANPERPLLWQIKADRIIHDQQAKDVTYRNATMEVAGVPVFYTPYFAHPDPSVKRRSGFLAPKIGAQPNLGFTTRAYYFLDIAPNQDATIETSYSVERGALLGGEWRHKTATSDVKLNVSGTIDDIPNDVSGQPARADKLRGHFFLDASMDLSDKWRAGADIRRTTDDTYLDLWNYDDADVLNSRLYLERFDERSYAAVEAYSFQDLRPNITSAEPQVLPRVTYRTQSKPQALLGGRWALGAETRVISRDSGETDSSRASADLGWRRDLYTPAGVVLTGEATARADAFYGTNLPGGDDAGEVRPFAQAQVTARLPMARPASKGFYFLEPIAQLTLAPNVSKIDPDIVNEDSQSLEFDFTNLFAPNRYSGADLQDGGHRVAYGARLGWAGQDGSGVEVGFGQSVAFRDEPGFQVGSGLDDQFSDFVGQVTADLPPYIDVAYSFRLDHETLEPRTHDLRTTVGPDGRRIGASYLYADQSQPTGVRNVREELTVGGDLRLTDYWSVSARHRHNLQTIGPIDSDVAFTYQDECLTFSLIGERDHIARSGLSSGDSVFFRITFKNLAEVESPTFSADFLGGQDNEK